MRDAAAKAQGVPIGFQWKPPGKEISILLDLNVLDRLDPAVMEGFWAVPKRGAEVGGVLIGRRLRRANETLVLVEDFEPVACEYRLGPSYAFSDADRQELEATLARVHSDWDSSRCVVGYYRSHTREDLGLSEYDLAIIERYFRDPAQVFLLIKPSLSKTTSAGFFVREHGHFRTDSSELEFPFSSTELKMQFPSSIVPFPESEPEQAVDRGPGAAAGARAGFIWQLSGLPYSDLVKHPVFWLSFATVLLLITALVQNRTIQSRKNPPLQATSTYPDLRVERQGEYLRLKWNRAAVAVADAERGTMSINDGAFKKVLELDASQLRAGSIAYVPSSGDVNFRLELVNAGRTVAESVRVVSPGELATAVNGVAAGAQAPAEVAGAVSRPTVASNAAAKVTRAVAQPRAVARSKSAQSTAKAKPRAKEAGAAAHPKSVGEVATKKRSKARRAFVDDGL